MTIRSSLGADLRYGAQTLEQIRDRSLGSRTFAMRLLVGFAVVAAVLTLAGVYSLAFAAVALIACSVPAAGAARVNPTDALKAE